MIDTSTKKPLRVSPGNKTGPYVMLPVAQLAEVCPLLDANNFDYWVDGNFVSIDGKPEMTVINFYLGTSVTAVQDVLDKASQ